VIEASDVHDIETPCGGRGAGPLPHESGATAGLIVGLLQFRDET